MSLGYHEAGHALAALLLGVGTLEVVVNPFDSFHQADSKTYSTRTSLIVMMGGPAAETLLFGRSRYGGQDMRDALGLATRATNSAKAADVLVRKAMQMAETLLTPYRPVLEGIAQSLVTHGRLSAGDLLEIAAGVHLDGRAWSWAFVPAPSKVRKIVMNRGTSRLSERQYRLVTRGTSNRGR